MKDSLIRKQINLVIKFYSILDEVMQIEGLCEISDSVLADRNVFCCDMALPVL